MELLFNKQKFCPECLCSAVVKEEVEADGVTFGYQGYPRKIREHAHGGRWETRTFLCGFSSQYVPNSRGNEVKSRCHETEEFKAAVEKRAEIRDQISTLEAQLRSL